MPALIDIPARPDVRVVHSVRRDGDFRPDGAPNSHEVRRRLADLEWTQLTEDHGVEARWVDAPGRHDGASGDITLTRSSSAVLGVWVGDCAPVVVLGDEVVAGVHAGWRGARDGALERSISAMREAGDEPRVAIVGAHIRPCCYEFGDADLASMVDRFGPSVAARDRRGRTALDMTACVRTALTASAPALTIIDVGLCTGCRGDLFFSHRTRSETERQVLAVWRVES